MGSDPDENAKRHSRNGSISVLIPTYKHAPYIAQTLNSVLDQSRPPTEVIVINDGSPDDTFSAVAPIADRITYIEQENRGLVYTLNKGLPLCSGEYVLIIASDDWLTNDALKVMGRVLDEQPSVGLVHGDVTPVDLSGAEISDFAMAIAPLTEHREVIQLLLGNFIAAPATLCRHAALRKLSFGDYPYCQDWRMWLEMGLNGWSYYGIQQKVAYYRRHAGNLTHHRNSFEAIRDELRMLTDLRLEYDDLLTGEQIAAIGSSKRRLYGHLGWLAISSGDRRLARESFLAVLRSKPNWNGALGLLAATLPSFFYDRLNRTRSELTPPRGQ